MKEQSMGINTKNVKDKEENSMDIQNYNISVDKIEILDIYKHREIF